MTLVNISIVDLGGAPSRGDYVTVWSPAFRGSGERLVSTAVVRVPLHEGVGQIDLQPGQNGYRTQSIQVTLDLAVDERIDFQAWAGADGADQRRMRDSEISVGWVAPPPNASDIT